MPKFLEAEGFAFGDCEGGVVGTIEVADHQQREHLEMATLLTGGSLASRFGKIGRLVSGAGMPEEER